MDQNKLIKFVRRKILAVTPQALIVQKALKEFGIDLGDNSKNTGKHFKASLYLNQSFQVDCWKSRTYYS